MKTILIPNQNNKLAAEIFAHITFSPTIIDPIKHIRVPRGVPESDLPMLFRIQSPTNSGQSFLANLITFARCRLYDLSSIETYLAAGVEWSVFIKNFMADNPGTTRDTEVAVYIYQKLTPNVDNQQPTPNNH